ncbi:hypothetical protein DAPPUDRAFT_313894 [Daphnia pulex]|uniref:Uncharacterized protein n=1 Tax=Daphnia pulex TaxID=6669 RepID=E9G5L6_DAPPU|nr:hypothetical protein DAPPUDRAFT_313894 [Daphnia pulex]|eukprot:EFX85225.1 hypothetical protein DAPPUDRAFT_313894 [Daphnia pulex]
MLADSNEDCDDWEIFYWNPAFIIIIIPHSFHKSAMQFFKFSNGAQFPHYDLQSKLKAFD